jgi:hypothetical protein
MLLKGSWSTIDNDLFSEEEENITECKLTKCRTFFQRRKRTFYQIQIDKMLHISSEEEEDITECKLTKRCTFFQRRKRRTLDRMQIDKTLHIFSEEEEEDIRPNANWQNVAHFFRGGRGGHYTECKLTKCLHVQAEAVPSNDRERVRNLVPHGSCCKYIWFIKNCLGIHGQVLFQSDLIFLCMEWSIRHNMLLHSAKSQNAKTHLPFTQIFNNIVGYRVPEFFRFSTWMSDHFFIFPKIHFEQ